MLPDWLKQLGDECPPEDLEKLNRLLDMNKTQSQRTARLKASNAKKGLVQVSVWIPAERAAELKAQALAWRQE